MILNIFQISLSILLIFAILIQGKGGGLIKKWKGESFQSKKGIEKIIFFLTIFLVVLFLISSILIIISA